jgi:Histidine phosphatase superfamily (branch 2)
MVMFAERFLVRAVCAVHAVRCASGYALAPLGTKRPYHDLDPAGLEHLLPHLPDAALRLPAASRDAVYVAVVARHGARFPTRGKLAQVVDLALLVAQSEAASTAAKSWCNEVLATVQGATPGALTELGLREMQLMGSEVAQAYGSHLALDVRTSASSRCVASCKAFLEGAAAHWSPSTAAGAALLHESAACVTLDNALLRNYKQCDMLQTVRDAFAPELDATAVAQALAAVAAATGLPLSALDESHAKAAFYACQAEIAMKGGSLADAFSCSMLGGAAAAPQHLAVFEREEDEENYFLRGFGAHAVTRYVAAPLLLHITEAMETAAAAAAAALGADTTLQQQQPTAVQLLFTHDSSVLPLAALMQLITLPDAAGAAALCPFASRLIIELSAQGSISVSYNGAVLRRFEGGLPQWRTAYESELAVSFAEQCAVPAGFVLTHDEL